MKRKYLRNYLIKGRLEAGVDEAGRGCLAGPVFAGAVILPPNYKNPYLNDSKKIPENIRLKLREHIEYHALAYGVGTASQEEIDEHNILQASFMAMHRAIDQLAIQADHLLIDGNRFLAYPQINHNCLIKGDERYKAIAAASILAKTYRDDYMKKIAVDHPHYDWINNKGYGTPAHISGIGEHGLSPHHRLSFTKAFRESVEANPIH